MNQFVKLYRKLDLTRSTNEKILELKDYFESVEEKDKLWALALLSGRRPKRTVKVSSLRQWAALASEIPDWLFEECYHTVGDLAETIALLVSQNGKSSDMKLSVWMDFLKDLKDQSDETKQDLITKSWQSMNPDERFVFNKLITGGFRVGVSQKMIEKAISQYTGIESAKIAHRIMGNWEPSETTWDKLILEPDDSEDLSKPYPFYLAYPLQDNPNSLGDTSDWQAEWKWDGIRAQIIFREGEIYIWSRGEELVTQSFPEFQELKTLDTSSFVIDGEIVAMTEDEILPFQVLQKRIGRKSPGKKILADAPIALIAYDILELNNQDLRERQLRERREILHQLIQNKSSKYLQFSQSLNFKSWEELELIRGKSRENKAEGLMLKRLDSAYKVGRKRGDWWKWKVEPMTIDAVMIYAMAGHGRRANLFTDYTLAVWNDGMLVPVAKAYSGLTDAEIKEVDAFVKSNTIEKFGPVRSVKAELVFEIGFENIQESKRHKSGVALRFPRILRWRKDKPANEADHLSSLIELLEENRITHK